MAQEPTSSPPLEKAPVGEEPGWLRHLGLPFYYRHLPSPMTRRLVFWGAFVLGAIWVFLNVLMMPFPKDSALGWLRILMLGPIAPYRSFEKGGGSLFLQFAVLAVVLSGGLAPLYATFSLASERVTGTFEFLRLTPLSTYAILLGKMFAPGMMLHLVSLGFFLFGSAVGLLAGATPSQVGLLFLTTILNVIIMHALGALLVSFTVAWRGFFPIAALLLAGFFIYSTPAAVYDERELCGLAMLSPFGVIQGIIKNDYWPYRRTPMFFNSEEAVVLLPLVVLVSLAVLMFWAAKRRLEHPERPGLPALAWFGLWCLVLLVAIGISMNDVKDDYYFAPYEFRVMLEHMIAILVSGCGGVCFLAWLDAPHDRETCLTGEMERLAKREQAASDFRLGHALFVSLLAAFTAGLVFALAVSFGEEDWSIEWLLLATGIPAAAFFFGSLVLETACIFFANRWLRFISAPIVLVLAFVLCVVSAVHLAVAHHHLNRALAWGRLIAILNEQGVEHDHGLTAQPIDLKGAPFADWRVRSAFWDADAARTNYLRFFRHLTTRKQVDEEQRWISRYPVSAFARYLPLDAAVYLLLFGGFAGLVIFLRGLAYRRLTREAQAAVKELKATAPASSPPLNPPTPAAAER